MKKSALLLLTFLLSVSVYGNEGDVFTANTVEGVQMSFIVLDETNMTCAVNKPAIDYSTEGVLTIPSKANGYTVVSIERGAFGSCYGITSVIIPSTISDIGESAFYNCTSLASIILPESITSIAAKAFRNCTSLTSITIPSGVTSIEANVFCNCSSLSSITLSENITSIGYQAFYECEGLASVTLPEGLVSINENAFYGCRNITTITLPSTVTSIATTAFLNMRSLTSVTCLALVPPTIGKSAFSFSSCYLYVPESCLDAYRNAENWKTFAAINAITSSGGTAMHPSLDRCALSYYDYDGDGVMEMIGLYDKNGYFGLMSDQGVIKQFSLVNDFTIAQRLNAPDIAGRPRKSVTPLAGSSSSSGFNLGKNVSLGTQLGFLNGNGMLMYGSYLQQSDGEWVSNKQLTGFPVDLDCDGRLDFVSIKAGTPKALLQQYDGTFLPIDQIVTLDSALLAEKTANKKGVYGGLAGMSASQALSMSFVVKGLPVGYKQPSGVSMAFDLNGDGRPDLLNSDGTSVLMTLDGNTYVEGVFNGQIYPYDLNDDGILDYLLYADNVLYSIVFTATGEVKKQQIFSNSNIKFFICRDFDHDGDADPLAFVSDGTNTYFVFLRNDGNGTFKKKESYVEGSYEFLDCKDYDADGQYEVMVAYMYRTNAGQSGENAVVTKIFKIEKDYSLTDVSMELETSQVIDMGDFDNDGYTDFKLVRKNIYNESSNIKNYWGLKNTPHVVGRYTKQTVRNTAPQKMSKPVVQLDDVTGFLRILWEKGLDVETSASDLTYDVRIGTEPGKGDVLFAPALADGRRRVVGDGSQGTSRQMMFNIGKHHPGTYYVAVQAIDAGGLGGAWSDEVTYEHVYTAPVISSSMQTTTTADTITVVASGDYDENIQYKWSASNGEVISQHENQAQIIFHVAGRQQVMLTTQNGSDGRCDSEPLTVIVNPFKTEGDGMLLLSSSFDINQDGYADGLNGNYNGYLIVNDGKGNLKRYPKSFNADMSLSSVKIVDINKDGYPDLTGISDEHNFYINDGEGEFDFQDKDITILNRYVYTPGYTEYSGIIDGIGSLYTGKWIDMFNTGDISTLDNYSIWTSDNYITFTRNELFGEKSYQSFIQTTDLNRDGFTDIVYLGNKNREYTIFALMGHANGDGGFDKLDILDVSSYSSYSFNQDPYGYIRFVDVNNDGYKDILIYNRTKIALDIYAGQQGLKWQKTHSIDLSTYECISIFSDCEFRDFDNNGYLDVCMGGLVLFFYNDWNYEVSDNLYDLTGGSGSTEFASDPFVVLKDGGYPQMAKLANTTITNLPPQAPKVVGVKQDKNGLVINWSDANDDYTPAMQMRYNISVKRKGKEGENSYIISPMNGDNSKASLVYPYDYKQSTTMTVPMRALKAGETYEVRVQAIDLWNQHSPMTEPVEITIVASGYIEAPTLAATGKEVTLHYMGTSANTVECNPGEGGAVVDNNGNGNFVCSWSTAGLKEITIGTLKTQIMIRDAVDVTFSVPEKIYARHALPVSVQVAMAAQSAGCGFRVIEKPSKWSKVDIQYVQGDSEATMLFNEVGTYIIESYCEDSVLGSTYRQTVEVLEPLIASISSVTVDPETGRYVICWPVDQPSDVVLLDVMKEGSSLNSFYKVATVNIVDGRYVDMTSLPATVSTRYKIVLLTKGGQRIESDVHKPLHVMIGQAAAGGYNLMWNAYEGLTVDNYQILRGTSADDMTVIDQVAGSQQSYTDLQAPEGLLYYAIAFSSSSVPEARRYIGEVGSQSYVRSNVIPTSASGAMTLATSLKVLTASNVQAVINDSNPELQLSYILQPNYCYYNKVAWSIVEGDDLVTVNTDGTVKANGKNGTAIVKVRATTLDGSNIKDEITINVSLKKQEAEQQINAVSINNGIYYVYNPASGMYLTGANYWGTCASLSAVGIDFLMEKADDNNGITVDSRYYLNNTNHYLGWPTTYIDQPAVTWYFVAKGNGYLMTADGKEYLAFDGESTILKTTTNADDLRAQWQLLTREDLIAQMAEATKANPYNASMLIAYPDFSRSGKTRNQAAWTDYPTIGGVESNYCAEKFDCTFDMSQTLTGLPNGHYKLKVQGFYREGADESYNITPAVELRKQGGEHLYAKLYANEKEKPLMSIFDEADKYSEAFESEVGIIPNNLSQASSFFDTDLYWNEVGVNVTNGSLKIGIKKSDAVYHDWTCFDSFRLYYYGPEMEQEDEVTTIRSSSASSAPFDVYSANGQKVRHQVTSLRGLPKGIYIVRGEKVVVR